MHSKYKPILPKPSGESGDTSQDEKLSKRRRVGRQNACTACRTRKSRCDGNAPRCTFCTKRGTECFYKRNYIENLREEHQTFRDILDQLKTSPETEALEILQRLRAASDLYEFLASIKGGGRYRPSDVDEDQAVSIPTLPNVEFGLMAVYPTLPTPDITALKSNRFLEPAQSPEETDPFGVFEQSPQPQDKE